MTKFSLNNENPFIHFVGIGGRGMSGIAEILHKSGVVVSGCDRIASSTTEHLSNLGILIRIGHDANHVTLANTSRIVLSSAIPKDNEEISRAKELGIPIIHRSDMLFEIMSSYESPIVMGGTHGKSTITAMISTLLSVANFSPTIINGGILNLFGTNAVLGDNKNWIVVETDESDGSFLKIPNARMAIVSNIDLEHMEYFKTEENLENEFTSFIHKVQENGLVILCSDCPRLKRLIQSSDFYQGKLKILTYGLKSSDESGDFVNIRGTNIRFMESGMKFDVEFIGLGKSVEIWKDLTLSEAFGEHNVQNALAVIAVAQELRLEQDIIRNSLSGYSGIERRFSCTGSLNNTRIFNDNAHHPTEISAVVTTARFIIGSSTEKLIAIHQPNRSSRLENLFREYTFCFRGADQVILLPVYECTKCNKPCKLASDLANAIQKNFPQLSAFYINTFEDVMEHVATSCTEMDVGMIVCMGVGPIDKLAKELPEFLRNRAN